MIKSVMNEPTKLNDVKYRPSLIKKELNINELQH